ncbi:MAG: glycosyltransferase family 10 [Candidatus Kapaibacterium sp.]
MKPKIRIYFTDFWNNFDIHDNYFTHLLRDSYEIIIDKLNPDFLFYSNFGIEHINYLCTKIYFTGENIRPDFSECDWAFSFDFSDDDRNYRLPLYALFADLNDLTKARDAERHLKDKTKFSNFIYSNPGAKKRRDFFFKLSEYKKVDSAGRYMNNIGGSIGGFEDAKRKFIRDYKFTIAFENSSYPGYTTEKILDPFLCHSVPIYWGSPRVSEDFNPEAFLNYHDYHDEKEFIDRIIEIDNNDKLLLDILNKPPFINNELNKFVNPENVLMQFKKIFNSDISPVALESPLNSGNKLQISLWKFTEIANYRKKILQNKINNFSFDRIIVRIQRINEKLKQ